MSRLSASISSPEGGLPAVSPIRSTSSNDSQHSTPLSKTPLSANRSKSQLRLTKKYGSRPSSPQPKEPSPKIGSPLNKSLTNSDSIIGYDKMTDHPLNRKTSKAFHKGSSDDNTVEPEGSDRLWSIMDTYLKTDSTTIQHKIVDHMEYTLARTRDNLSKNGAYLATAYSVRDRLIEFWNDTNLKLKQDPSKKRVYYMSIEYLLGRSLLNALTSLDIEENYAQSLKKLGFALEELYDEEQDAGIGNGGLGRLAACYLDSMATTNIPGWGYGLKYSYGMFKQMIFDGWQTEIPDPWLKNGFPWGLVRTDVKYPIRLYGQVEGETWFGGETVLAIGYDVPIPGWKTPTCVNLRLWESAAYTEFDLQVFNQGNYYKAVEKRQQAETISSVLYPNDSTPEGKELRLKQQYFFAAATLRDIVRRYKKNHTTLERFHEAVAIQLNDTHPTISIAELMRVLVDEEGMLWDDAFEVVYKTFSYTNHTILPEALERWSVDLLNCLLPRHLQIIYKINYFFMEMVKKKYPNDNGILSRVSIVEESNPKMIRMGHLAIVCSHKVNGVAKIHSEILQKDLFPEFVQIFPGKFINITNGITTRRWLLECNRELTNLITSAVGNEDFLVRSEKLSTLAKFASDVNFQAKWKSIKQKNKEKLANYIKKTLNIDVDPTSLFDIQVKRIHEYKRQLLNLLRVVYEYKQLKKKAMQGEDAFVNVQKKTIIFGGKAAPGYHKAKTIIKLINLVAMKISAHPLINQYLKVVYMPNYNVSLAELLTPANDISQHISTAGLEASGTSNMKFALNGGLIVGTLDGANIEIADAIGHENMFIFGLTADKVQERRQLYKENPKDSHFIDHRFFETIEFMRSGEFGDPNFFVDICDSVCFRDKDWYLVADDFGPYLDTMKKVDAMYHNQAEWTKKSILTTSGMGYFNSDRSVKEYCEKVWNVEPINWDEGSD